MHGESVLRLEEQCAFAHGGHGDYVQCYSFFTDILSRKKVALALLVHLSLCLPTVVYKSQQHMRVMSVSAAYY